MRRRVGYNKGGVVKPAGDRRTYVTGDDLAKQVNDRYEQVMQEGMPSRGYARGGAVRQNFRRGGVPTDPEAKSAAGWGLWADEEAILNARRRKQEQADADAAAAQQPPQRPQAPASTTDPNAAFRNSISADGTYGVQDVNTPVSYAQGGVVRRNYWEGGEVPTDPVEKARAGWGLFADEKKKYHQQMAGGSGDLQINSVTAGGQSMDPGSSQFLAGGGVVRQNFRRGGTAFKDDAERRARMEEQNRMQAQIDAAEQQRYNAMGDHEKRIYQLNHGTGIDGQGTTFRGTNDALGGAGSIMNDPGSMQALADYSSVSAGAPYSDTGGGTGQGVSYGSGANAPDTSYYGTSGGSDYAEGGYVEDMTGPSANAAGALASIQAVNRTGDQYGMDYFSSGRAMGQPQAAPPSPQDGPQQFEEPVEPKQPKQPRQPKEQSSGGKGKRGRKKKARTGYAEGGAVDEYDTMGNYVGGNGAVAPTDPMVEVARREAAERARLEAEQRAQQQAAQQRAADEQRQASDREAMASRDREPPQAPQAPAQTTPQAVAPPPNPADVARQQSDVAAMQTRDIEPAPAAPVNPVVPPQAPNPADVARQQADTEALASRGPAPQPQQPDPNATPWYRQVYDSLVSRLQSDASAAEEGRGGFDTPQAQTGYAKDLAGMQAEGAKQKEIAATPFPQQGSSEGFFDPRRDAERPEDPNAVKRINPYDRMNLEKYGVPGEKFATDMAETTKNSWLHKLLGGEKSYTMSELNDIQKQDPGRDISGHLQEKWRQAELQGNQGEAERIQQTVRHGFNLGTSTGLDRLNNGDLPGALKAIQHSLNMFTDDKQYTLVPTPDGQVQIQIKPEKPGMGEPSVTNVSPAQLRDLFSSNGGQFDHLMHNGVKESLDMLTGRNKPMRVPDPREDYANRPGYADNRPVDSTGNYVASTAHGYHPDSAMGLMDRAQEAARYGRPDREAEQYFAKAKAAVRAGVAPDEVHTKLREGFDPFAKPADGAAPTNAPIPGGVARIGGKLTYDPIYDIPGSRSPNTPTDVSGVDTGDRRRIGPGDSYTSREQHRDAGSSEVHRDAKGGGGSKTSRDVSSDISTSLYPKEHFREPDWIGYAHGERRAGSQAQGRPEDYAPISKMQGPPVPPGFQPPERERDVFERGRGGGGNAIAPPNRTNSREEVLRYNAQLAERQNQYQPAGRGDTAYEARNRQLNQGSGYAAAQDRQAAELKQATAAADTKYKTEQAEYDRVRNKYGYYTQELAAQDKAGNAPPIRYTDDWRRVPRPPTQAEHAEDIKYPRQLEMKTAPAQIQAAGRADVANINQAGRLATTQERNQSRESIAAGQNVSREGIAAGQNRSREGIAAGQNQSREDIAAGQNQSREGIAAGQNQSRESIAAGVQEGANLRARDVINDRQANRQFLESKQVQDILSREGTEAMKQSMAVFKTKLAQDPRSITPDELENYQILQNRVRQALQPAAAGAPTAQMEAPGTAAPPGPAQPGYKWQNNTQTGQWRQVPI